MPRIARVKTPDSKFHIMVRSLKELDLFKENEDKVKYLTLIKKYQIKYGFKVYAYCLMNNHGHLLIDSAGADISKIMQGINLSYAYYFNKKYNRYGPVFQDRFKSKIVSSERYFLTLSAYIHNNPKDIVGYENNVKEYPFSSLKEYIHQSNTFGILSPSFLINLIGCKDLKAHHWYFNLVKASTDESIEIDIEFEKSETTYESYKSILPKNSQPTHVIGYLSHLLSQNPNELYMKYRRSSSKFRALFCLLMSCFCDLSSREICEILGNITQSGVSSLIAKGIDIVAQEQTIIDNFI